MAVLSGTVKISQAKVQAYLNADKWTGRRWMWVDPLKDIQAQNQQIALHISNPIKAAEELGEDFETNCQELKRANEICKANGLPPIQLEAPTKVAESESDKPAPAPAKGETP